MVGFLPLLVAAYFIWKANYHMENDQDGLALLKLCLGMFIVFLMGAIFL